MSTKETIGQFDALEKAEPNEPMFPLLARDECAPATVTEWCRLRRNRAFKLYGDSAKDTDKELLAAELRQCANAEDVALQFVEWRKREAPADVVKSTYNEVIRSAEEVAEADRRKRQEQAVADLGEAGYYLCEARDALASLGLIGELIQRDMTAMLDLIKSLSAEHKKTRPRYIPESV